MDDTTVTTIPTNLRLLAVLEEVARVGVPVTPTEVNAILGLPKPTIHRLFTTLEQEGYLQRDIDGRAYSPGRRLRGMATGVMSSLRIRSARLAILRKLSAEIGETCNISLPGRDSMTYIERVETEWPLRIQLPIGTEVPFYCTAAGKMYLSSLPDAHLRRYAGAEVLMANTPNTISSASALIEEVAAVRSDDFAVDREEFMEGMIAIAVPIRDAQKRIVSTLSFHAPTQRYSIEKALTFLPSMYGASRELSALMLEERDASHSS